MKNESNRCKQENNYVSPETKVPSKIKDKTGCVSTRKRHDNVIHISILGNPKETDEEQTEKHSLTFKEVREKRISISCDKPYNLILEGDNLHS